MRIDPIKRRWRLRRFAQVGLFALLVAGPLSALALGLGEPIVKSHLGERLLVQIPLILDDGERADEITVRLASAADRARFGNSSEISTVQMRLAVVMSGRGGPSISVTSAASVREPALNFVVEVKTSSTRFMREYAVLLDPVNYRAARKIAATGSVQIEPAPAPIATTVPRPVAALSPIARAIDGDTYGPVSPGDTLSELGAKLRADSGVSVSQMSIALFQANPHAFIDRDVNRLVAGAYLRVPNRDESTATSSRAARERLYGPALPQLASTAMSDAPAKAPIREVAASPLPAKALVRKSAEVAAGESATLQTDAAKFSSQTPPEPQFRLSILAADPLPDSEVESVISRLSGSNDIAVRDLVVRMENARQADEELTRENLDLRRRIAAADTRITKLAAELRERNERIAAVQAALETERAATLHSVSVPANVVDIPSLEERSESVSSSFWQWGGVFVALVGIWILVRRNLR